MQIKRILNVRYGLAAAAFLLTCVVYLPSLGNQFVGWDDDKYIFENPYIRSLDLPFLKWAFFDFHASNWHPLTWISHAVDYAVWGLNPLGHHLTSTILHAANTFLVVILVMRLLDIYREASAKNGPAAFLNEQTILITAGVTGVLFGLHPVHVESVAWVAERKDLLCALFFLLSLTMYASYARSADSEAVQDNVTARFLNRHYLLALGFFALALLSKPMAVTLPLVLLVLDWCLFRKIHSFRSLGAAVVEKIPFIALSAISSIVTILAQKAGGAISSLEVHPFSSRVLVAASSLIAYLWKMILPTTLVPYYPYPRVVSLFMAEYIFAIILVAGITAACLVVAKKQKVWLSAWGYYVLTLIPVIGLFQVGDQAMADRYTYLPSLGPFLLTGLLAAWGVQKISIVQGWSPAVKLSVAGTAVLAAGLLAGLTVRQIKVWENTFTLWTYVIEKEPEFFLAYNNRGLAFSEKGDLQAAITDYDTSIALNPAYPLAYYNRARDFQKMGRLDRALEDYNKAIELNPSYFEAYNNRGIVFYGMGRFAEAIENYKRALALKPSYATAHYNCGLAYVKSGLFPNAIDSFDTFIEMRPDYGEAYLSRGKVYLETGDRARALADFQKACGLMNEGGCKALHDMESRP